MNNEEKILAILEQLTGNVTDLKQDMTEMRGEMVEMRGDIAEIQRGQAEMRGDIVAIQEEQTSMRTEMTEMRGDLDFVRASVVRIEHEHGRKLDALFDGYQLLYEKTARIEEHVVAQDEVILRRVFPKSMEK